MEIYLSHSDTITVNTWFNIRRSNQLLGQIVAFDDSLIEIFREFMQTLPQMDSIVNRPDSTENIYQSSATHSQLSVDEAETNILDTKYFYLVLLIFLIVILILSVNIRLQTKKTVSKDSLLKQYHTELFNAKQEVVNLDKTHNVLASEINTLKRELDQLSANKVLFQEAMDEKVMLENQMHEVRKVYLLEVEKRKELDMKLMDFEAERNEEMNILKAEITSLNQTLSKAESSKFFMLREFDEFLAKIKNRFT